MLPPNYRRRIWPVPLRQCHIQVCYLVNNVLQRTRSVPLCYPDLNLVYGTLIGPIGSYVVVIAALFIVLLLSSKLPHLARSEGLVAIQETEE